MLFLMNINWAYNIPRNMHILVRYWIIGTSERPIWFFTSFSLKTTLSIPKGHRRILSEICHPLSFYFQYDRKIELEILHLFVYLFLFFYWSEKIFQDHFVLGVSIEGNNCNVYSFFSILICMSKLIA